jgi:hypothetical protein
VKAGPPGWQPHQIARRVDGWCIDPENEDRIPAAVAAMIVEAMPQPGDHDAIAIIRRRMMARQRAYERKKKVRIARQRMFERVKKADHE